MGCRRNLGQLHLVRRLQDRSPQRHPGEASDGTCALGSTGASTSRVDTLAADGCPPGTEDAAGDGRRIEHTVDGTPTAPAASCGLGWRLGAGGSGVPREFLGKPSALLTTTPALNTPRRCPGGSTQLSTPGWRLDAEHVEFIWSVACQRFRMAACGPGRPPPELS